MKPENYANHIVAVDIGGTLSKLAFTSPYEYLDDDADNSQLCNYSECILFI